MERFGGSFTHHTQDSRPGVLQFEVLIFESRAINGLSTRAVMVGEVSSLTHAAKTRDWRKMISQHDSIRFDSIKKNIHKSEVEEKMKIKLTIRV